MDSENLETVCRGEASGDRKLTTNSAQAPDASSLHTPRGTVKGSLVAMIQNFKSVSTRKVNQLRGTPGEIIWQRNYYDHIIRTEHALLSIKQYIQDNPARWEYDQYNPDRKETDTQGQNLWEILFLNGVSQRKNR